MTARAFPEWLSRYDTHGGSWTVESGSPVRGDAWTDSVDRRMRVPMDVSEASRVIRAHEMMHAKVSPIEGLQPRTCSSLRVNRDMAVAMEEFRVNMLCSSAGFDMDQLLDGSERIAGQRVAEAGSWNQALLGVVASAGTKGCKKFISGVASVDSEMAKSLRVVHKELLKDWRRYTEFDGVDSVASTMKRYVWVDAPDDPEADGDGQIQAEIPEGFMRFTIELAGKYQSSMVPDRGEFSGDRNKPSPGEVGDSLSSRVGGHFANLVLGSLPLTKRVDGRIGKRRTPSNIGKDPKYIERLITDPERRVFTRTVRGKGGIVLIDQSGSMHLDDDDIWRIIEHAPGCVIIGYSHAAGSTDVPNVWVIADRGKVASRVPEGNGGNGVDGPAIRFAQTKRRKGEPFVWVCDGSVTDGDSDGCAPALDRECIELVYKHGITMVEEVDEAIEMLKTAAKGKRLPTQFTGRLKRVARY